MKRGLLFILLMLIFTSCVQETVYIPECDSKEEQGKRDICYNNEAIENHDFRFCDKISTEEKKEWCIYMVEKAMGPRPKEGWFN